MTRTPLERNERLSDRTGAEVWLKREDLQVVRSYKLRGAYNLIAQLDDAARAAGVVCASAGNHAQGVAYACRLLGVHGADLPPAHHAPAEARPDRPRSAARRSSWSWCGDTYDEAAAAASEHAATTGATPGARLRRPADDRRPGHGRRRGRRPARRRRRTSLVVPVGGGGLLAGSLGVAARAAPVGAGGRGRAGRRGLHGGGARRGRAGGAGGHRPLRRRRRRPARGRADLPGGARTARPELVAVDEGRVCSEMLALYQSDGIIAEPAGALAVRRAGRRRRRRAGPARSCACCPAATTTSAATPRSSSGRWSHEGRKHYFLVDFPQEPGALRRFLDEVLGPDDDITLFEYVKRSNRETGPALVGIELGRPEDLAAAAGADGGRAAADREGRQRQPAVPVPAVTPPGFAAGPNCRDDGGPMTLSDLLPPKPEPDAIYDAFAGWVEGRGIELYPAQQEALIEIVTGANVILSTPDRVGQEPGRHRRALRRARRGTA